MDSCIKNTGEEKAPLGMLTASEKIISYLRARQVCVSRRLLNTEIRQQHLMWIHYNLRRTVPGNYYSLFILTQYVFEKTCKLLSISKLASFPYLCIMFSQFVFDKVMDLELLCGILIYCDVMSIFKMFICFGVLLALHERKHISTSY